MAKIVNVIVTEPTGDEPGHVTVILDDGRIGTERSGFVRGLLGIGMSKEEAIQSATDDAFSQPVPKR